MELLSKSDQEIKDTLVPLIEKMETAWDNDDHASFISHFSKDMKKVATKDDFDKQRNKTFPIFGKHKFLELIILHKNPKSITIIWKRHCELHEIPVLLITSFINENDKVVISSAFITQ